MGKKLTKNDLIKKLNSDLCGELQAIMQYLLHAYTARGLIREPIAERLESHAKDEMKHAEELAKRIVALGGVPDFTPGHIKRAEKIVEMLEQDLEGEAQALKDYALRRDECEQMGEVGTALIIENFILDEQHHHDSLLMLLREEKNK